jgi:hypothetical protein
MLSAMYVLYFMNPVGMPTIYVPTFSISLLYQPDDGPLGGLKHVTLAKICKDKGHLITGHQGPRGGVEV